jgi:hypothetical protein
MVAHVVSNLPDILMAHKVLPSQVHHRLEIILGTMFS